MSSNRSDGTAIRGQESKIGHALFLGATFSPVNQSDTSQLSASPWSASVQYEGEGRSLF